MLSPARAPRTVAFVSETFLVPGCGIRVSLVTEGDDFHRPTGDWPDDGKDHGKDMVDAVRPWFWGNTIAEARRAADAFNTRNGISAEDAWTIVAQSMSAGRRRLR